MTDNENSYRDNRVAHRRNDSSGEKKPSRIVWYSLGCLTSIVLSVIVWITLIVGIAVFAGTKTPDVKPNSFLHIVLSGGIEEHKAIDDNFLSMSVSHSASEIIAKIKQAADDQNIDGILLEPRFIMVGYAVLNEIAEAIEYFQSKGKLVYAYLETASNQDYYLSAFADQIFLDPAYSSGIYLTGTAVSSLYLKDMLDKLGVEMTVVHSGKFKGAGEEFSRRTMSAELKQSLDELLDHRYQSLISDIAINRNLEYGQVFDIFDKRDKIAINGEYALNSGLVDRLMGKYELRSEIEGTSKRLLKLSDYKVKSSAGKADNKIAVVYLTGNITMGSDSFLDMENYITAASVKSIFDDLKDDDRVKAVVLRVNSPGGSALVSETIYRIIEDFRKEKPVVVSMSNVAASGGYYISAPADYIFADPYTLTGSIGVVSMIPNLHQAGKKIGANPQTLSRGKYSNFLNLWEPLQRSDVEALKQAMDDIYEEFVGRVAQGRNLEKADAEKVAQGRIWTSSKALQGGLIDEIGSMNRAISKAAEFQGITDYQIEVYPKTKSFVDLLLERRFNLSAAKHYAALQLLPDKEIIKMVRLYHRIKDDPIQFLTPTTLID